VAKGSSASAGRGNCGSAAAGWRRPEPHPVPATRPTHFPGPEAQASTSVAADPTAHGAQPCPVARDIHMGPATLRVVQPRCGPVGVRGRAPAPSVPAPAQRPAAARSTHRPTWLGRSPSLHVGGRRPHVSGAQPCPVAGDFRMGPVTLRVVRPRCGPVGGAGAGPGPLCPAARATSGRPPVNAPPNLAGPEPKSPRRGRRPHECGAQPCPVAGDFACGATTLRPGEGAEVKPPRVGERNRRVGDGATREAGRRARGRRVRRRVARTRLASRPTRATGGESRPHRGPPEVDGPPESSPFSRPIPVPPSTKPVMRTTNRWTQPPPVRTGAGGAPLDVLRQAAAPPQAHGG
jgi:hypothetical protein